MHTDTGHQRPRLALVLSGGGVRATVFHLGVLLWLARQDRLQDVITVSTVSGGSLAAALTFAANQLRWPTAETYTGHVLAHARKVLTERSLQGRALCMTLKRPWTLFGSRGNLFASALATEWGICGNIKNLPEMPLWRINATTYETGRNWRFTRRHIGDYQIGHNYDQDVPIALAVAASAAIPYMAGFVKLPLAPAGWHAIDPKDETPLRPINPLRPAVRLWDGGVYENLGIESVWKPRGYVDRDVQFMIVSDASAYLGIDTGVATGVFTCKPPFIRPPRLFDIATEQTRALRSRMLVDTILTRQLPAAILRIGRSVGYIDNAASRQGPARAEQHYLDATAAKRAGRYPTNASRMSADDFDLLLRHGFETADATLTGHAASHFPESLLWK